MSRINTNVAALNTNRMLGRTNAAFSKSVGRLSSGFRINRAGDDAAGLGIANKIRNDVRGLKQASSNAEQGTALLQVAEGALSEVQNIVDRMKELAAQAASSNSGDRTKLNSEFSDLRSEIGRIVATVEFQDKKLINGTLGNTYDSVAAGTTIDSNADVQTSTVKAAGSVTGTFTLAKVDATHMSITAGATSNTEVITVASTGVQSLVFAQHGVSFDTATGFDISGSNNSFTANNALVVAAGANAADFLVSATGDFSGQDLVSIGQINAGTAAANLDLDASDLTSAANAQAALTKIEAATSKVSGFLADIGSAQNRIDFARANTDTMIENFMAAESVVRDADLAAESVEFARLQILQQAATAVLAQANSAPQGVLQLLR